MFHASVSSQFYGAPTGGSNGRWAASAYTVKATDTGDVELTIGGLVAEAGSLSAYVNGVMAVVGAECTLVERGGQSYVVFPRGGITEGDVLAAKALVS